MTEKEKVILPGAPFGRGARENTGEWHPLIDWFDVYPGNRWKDRHGQFGLFDSPAGIRLQVEEAKVSAVLFAETADRQGGLLPLYAWKEDGLYRMLYRDTGGTAYAQSENGYHWTLPELGRIEFGGSTKNNLVCDQCVGHVMKDPQAPPQERFKGMVEVAGMFDPDTGEELEGEEGLKRMGEMQFGGSDYKGPRMVMRAFVRGFTSPDAMHWTRIERPVADMPSDGTGSNPTFEPETKTYFSYVRVHGLEQGEFQTLAHSTPERDSARRCIGFTRTRDFFDWPPPKLVLHPDADDGPHVSFYGGFYFPFPGRHGIHCMLVHVFDQISGHVDNQIAFSRDGLLWDRPERRAAVPVGAAGSGCEGSVYAQGGIVELPDGFLGGAVCRRHRSAQWVPSGHAGGPGTAADALGAVGAAAVLRHRRRSRGTIHGSDPPAHQERAASELPLREWGVDQGGGAGFGAVAKIPRRRGCAGADVCRM